MAADVVEFQQLLNSLLSTDNDVRSRAEAAYNSIARDVKVTHLLGAIINNQLSEEVRLMAAVVLRRLFKTEFLEIYNNLSVEAKQQLLQQILLSVQQDVTPNLRRKICEVVAETARNLIDEDGNNQWPDILQFIFQCANSQSPQFQEVALRVLASVPTVFGNQEPAYMNLIKEMFYKNLNQNQNFQVRFQSARAIGAFVLLHENDEPVLKHFSDMLTEMIKAVAESIEKEDDQSLLKLLIDLTESCPKFLRPQLEVIFEMCMIVLNNSDINNTWRHLVLEVMISLSENAAAMVRKKAGKYIVSLVPVLLQMMTDLDEDESWAMSDAVMEQDNSDNNFIGESSLDRLACGLGGKTVLPLVLTTIPSMLENSDWKQRHAALMAISAIGEGCHKPMQNLLDEIMTGVLKYMLDPHPRVRYAACNAIGQMSNDFAPVFEKKFHEQVLPGLLSLLGDYANPRVQAHAGAALLNFSEDCPKHILVRYLDNIMGKLEEVLNAKFKELIEKGNKLVLEQIVTTIASVADTCENEFIKYYERFMPCLKYIIQNTNVEKLRMLRGKTIECVSLIGLAVGREKFLIDANEIMDMLIKIHTEGNLPDDDPQTSYLISAWARMCKILGKQFEQYLPCVMGPVMSAAAMKPEMALLDNDELQDFESDVDWSLTNMGEQNFAIRTCGLEDKAAACDILVCYARELKDGFANYAEEVVRLMVPLLTFYFHEGVRIAAAESLPFLLDCAKIKGGQYLEGMWLYICPELLKAISTELEGDVQYELLKSLASSIDTLGSNCLSEESINEILKIISKLMVEHFEKSDKRAQARNEEDYDDGVEELLAEEDNSDIYLLSKIADIIHSLFRIMKITFMPYFDKVAPNFVKLLDPTRPWADRQWGLCIFDYVIEFAGPMSVQYQQFFLTPLLQYVTDKSPEVRQSAAYGVGVLAQFGGDQFAITCAQALSQLIQIIQAPKSREPENANCTENAISAVTKILQYNNSAIQNTDEILTLWFSWLPVVEDQDEAPHVYNYLCNLIQSNNVIVLGTNNTNLPRIVSIISQVFTTDTIKPLSAEGKRLINIVKQIEANTEMFQACLAYLTDEEKHALEEACRQITTEAPTS